MRARKKRQRTRAIGRAAQIGKAYHAWKDLRAELERWNSLAAGFHDLQAQKAALDARIQAEGARLEQELVGLKARQKDISAIEKALPDLLTRQQELNARQTDMETRLQELGKIEDERTSAADKARSFG